MLHAKRSASGYRQPLRKATYLALKISNAARQAGLWPRQALSNQNVSNRTTS